jgi:ribosomal protein L16 Arg81 hydroxylase
LPLLEALYSLPRLEALLLREPLVVAHLDIFDGAGLRRLSDLERKSGRTAAEVVAEAFVQGSTIRLRDSQHFDERLSQFANEVAQQFVAHSDINIYLTPPQRAGFPPHFDITDVFIVQCLGSKQWRLYHDYSNMKALPLADTPWNPEHFRPSRDCETQTLCAGDVLYLPRGTMHEAYCGERESMHLTVSVAPLTYADLLAKALKRVADSDVDFRRRVRWSYGDPGGQCNDDLVQTAQQLIHRLLTDANLNELLAAERNTFCAEPVATVAPPLHPLESAIVDALRRAADQETPNGSKAIDA